MDTPSPASGARFVICPLCEASVLVFSGLYSARCPRCDYQPTGVFLKTLRQIVTLPDTSETPHSRPEKGTPNSPGE